MSHVTTGKLTITDIECLKEAVAEFPELEFMEGQTTFKWYGKWVNDYNGNDAAFRVVNPEDFGKCEHAIALKGDGDAYEIGVVRAPGGNGWLLLFDHWQQDRKIARVAGIGNAKLYQTYEEKMFDQKTRGLRARGYRKIRTELPSGAIRIQLVKS